MKKRKLNRVDFLVIAVVLLLIAGTCVKFLVLDPKETTARGVGVTYQMKIGGIRQYSVDALQVGDTIYTETGKAPVGVIQAIEVRPSEALSTYPDGTVRLTAVEDRYDVYLTVTASAVDDGAGGYKVGTYQLRRNAATSYITKYQTFYGQVLEISEEGA